MCYTIVMGKRMTTSEFIEKAIKVHNGKYDYSETVYVNSRQNVRIMCPIHGAFEQKAVSHLQGCGCPKCACVYSEEHKEKLRSSLRKARGMSTEEWIKRAKQVHGDKYDYSQTVYVNQRTNVKIICPVHGVFEQKADSHIRGCGCRLCGLQSENRKGVHNWSKEQHEKIQQTCLVKYGAKRYLDSDVGRKHMEQIKCQPEFKQKMRKIILSDAVQEKTKQTSLLRYGVPFPTQTKDVQDKIYRTKKKNHTVNSSKIEIKMYGLLVQRFGQNDVVHHYKQKDKYPFVCDFYIQSLELFIELNASWTHGHHWYDAENVEDVEILRLWQEKAVYSSYYRAAITTWTVRDVKKRQIALQNHLNYLVFWDNDLSDFIAWLNSDTLIMNNIETK